jgi:hypothetical protein
MQVRPSKIWFLFKNFMDEQAKINEDVVTKLKAMEKILKNLDGKVTEVESSILVHRDEDARDASGITCRAPDG